MQSPVRMNFSFKWRGGALLTAEEMDIVRKGEAPGLLREQGYEYASVFACGAVAIAQLVLSVPSEFAPQAGVEVKVFDEFRQSHPEETQELQARVINLGSGRYSLTVPYPRENWIYALAWRPVSAAALLREETFLGAARRSGDELLAAFREALPSALKSAVRLSLYVMGDDKTIAKRVGHLEPENAVAPAFSPALSLLARGDISALGQAFWGVPARAIRPEGNDDLALQIGFLDDELALLVLPVRFGFDWTSPIPWGVIRIGTGSPEISELLHREGNLEPMAFPAMIRMLNQAMSGTSIKL